MSIWYLVHHRYDKIARILSVIWFQSFKLVILSHFIENRERTAHV